MKNIIKKVVFTGLTFGFLLCLPVSAMESRVNTIPVFPRQSTVFCAEGLEQQLGLENGDLLAVTFTVIPEKGQLLAGGIPVERGETLLRRELEELCYRPDGEGSDWFAIVPICSERICAVYNLQPVL